MSGEGLLWFVPGGFSQCPYLVEGTRSSLAFLSEKAMAPHSSTLAWKIRGWRSLVGCSPRGCSELDPTKRLHFHFSLSCIGEGNGNPLQCSCMVNPRDGEAWWAAVYGDAQSRTRLKQLGSSSIQLLGGFHLHGTLLSVALLSVGCVLKQCFISK